MHLYSNTEASLLFQKMRLTILKLGISKYKVGFVFGHNGRA